jgi:ABC-type lipoprotein release transport system permease subunit
MLAHVLAQLLYEVSPRDRLVYTAVLGFVAAVAAIASWVPARRATRLDPVTALHTE